MTLGLLVLAILALLAVIAARVDAAPAGGVPPVAEVVAAAYRANGLDADRDRGSSWRWRTRMAGLVPVLTVRDGRDATWRDISDPTIGYVSIMSVSATWRLDRLVFDANELRISAIEAARHRERRRIAAQVIHAYYGWLHAVDAGEREEDAAVLDAFTDGWFSEMCAKGAESR